MLLWCFTGICLAVSVSLYQINATVQILDIGGLTTKSFEPGLLNIAFSFGFASAVIGFCGGTLLMFGTFTWVKPKGPRKVCILFLNLRCIAAR